jgi:hypothetical protein
MITRTVTKDHFHDYKWFKHFTTVVLIFHLVCILKFQTRSSINNFITLCQEIYVLQYVISKYYFNKYMHRKKT